MISAESEVLSVDGLLVVVRLVYDYGPFRDPFGPVVRFEGQVLSARGGRVSVRRGVLCSSLPNSVGGRVMTTG